LPEIEEIAAAEGFLRGYYFGLFSAVHPCSGMFIVERRS
jgi:hypothetical protein